MAAAYRDAPEAAAMADGLIAEVPDHSWLAGRLIAYLWRVAEKPGPVGVKAAVLTGVHAYLTRREGVLVIDLSAWTPRGVEARRALVDHGLSHFGCDDYGRLCLLKPPVAEFPAVVQRRGLWNRDLEAIAGAIALGPRPQSMLHDDTPVTITTPDGDRVDTTTGEIRRAAVSAAGR